jgi:uncharacterized protein
MSTRHSSFGAFPPAASWQHREAREGFEVTFFEPHAGGYRVNGSTSAVEEGEPWIVSYELVLDERWRTRHARVIGRARNGLREVLVTSSGDGSWRIDGEKALHLDGCFDVDLESSSFTNALPVRRMALAIGEFSQAPAAYVRALDLRVERLEQTYARTADLGGQQRFDYTSPAFDFQCVLVYDETGLVLDYPGIAKRVA